MTDPVITHEEATALAVQLLRDIGASHGRRIFAALVLLDLSMAELNARMDAAVSDLRKFLAGRGVCANDIEVSCQHLKLAIIQEGRRLAEMLPESVGSTIQ